MKAKSLSRVRLLATPWTAAYKAPPSIGFSRQEYWSGVPLPSPSMLSRLVISFLPRSKRLLISWLQSPSASYYSKSAPLDLGEGNGNTLQYSCLENPRDGGAWWAAVYGVAQSRK